MKQSQAVAVRIAAFICDTQAGALTDDVHAVCRRLLLDVTGLAFAARRTDYVRAALASCTTRGECTAIGHRDGLGMLDAALVNGTAAHGEDFDDTFEGGPVHAGAVIVPAVLAAAEQYGLGGSQITAGIAVGTELMCRLSLVAPQAIHRACFHPTAVIGAPAAAAAVSAALGLSRSQAAHALGIAGSLAAGIIEYLADGSSTKRLHAGSAAQSGIRAALMAQGGFSGPLTVFEGKHGFFRAFAPSVEPDFRPLTEELGQRWRAADIAFKPYACGTMTQPYIDCAIKAASKLEARGMSLDQIEAIECRVGEGTVHRLWEPLAGKHAPPNGYAGKFSTPYCIAVGLTDRRAGLEQFTDVRVRDPQLRALAARVRYTIDPNNPYPRRFTGHLRLTCTDGTTIEVEQDHMRGGVDAPLDDAEVHAKFVDNIRFGGGGDDDAARLLHALARIPEPGAIEKGMLQ